MLYLIKFMLELNIIKELGVNNGFIVVIVWIIILKKQ